MHRSLLVAGLGACLLSLGASTATAQTPLTTELFQQGLQSPVDLTFAPGDPSRIFIVEQVGRVRVVENGTLLATPFLDIASEVACCGERGLLGIAFHPGYQSNGRFFLNYTNNGGNTRVAEYVVSANPNVANPVRVQFIASIAQDFSNHNGGCVRFGPDGMLYVGMGDGGSGNDPNNRAQNGQQLLGKMLRFDVDLPAPFIPGDNPFVGNAAVRDEIWHLGVRNPWRFTFDRVTGDMWIGDVGQNAREEVDFIPVGVGGQNLGWRCLEGTRCTNLSGCSCTDPSLLAPIQEYTHGSGCSITGGVVYRGGAIPDLAATYFYADYCSNIIWSLRYNGTAVTDFTVRTNELRPASGNITGIVAFGEDFDGEIYICTQGGRIWKIIPEPPQCGWTNYCQAQPTSAGIPAGMTATGSSSITDNNFVIAASPLPSGTIGIFFYGPEQISVPSGLGTLCVGGNPMTPLTRMYPAVVPDIFGSTFRVVDFTSPQQAMGPGAIMPGQTVNFSFWFRDNMGGVPSYNFADGLSVLFCP